MSRDSRHGIPADAVALHATAVVLGDRGVLITGASGAGKSTLGLSLIGRWRAAGRHACLVADDQMFLAARGGRLAAWAPAATRGQAEALGYGPAPVACIPFAIIDLAVVLADDAATRFRPEEPMPVAEIALPRLALPCRSAQSPLAVAAFLGGPPFERGGISSG